MNTDKKLIITALVVLVLIGAVYIIGGYHQSGRMDGSGINDGGYTTSTSTSSGTSSDSSSGTGTTDTNGVICTADAMRCPDGTYVGRTGPHCEFVCPTPSTGGMQGVLTGELVGTVTLGPTCPVEQNPPDPQCADKPYQTTVVVTTNGREVGREATDAHGRFQFAFLPGTYSVTALSGATLPRCASQIVTLTKAATTTVALSCDTGIR